MANSKIKGIKPVNDESLDHFGFKVDDSSNVIDGKKVYCFHCEKVFVFYGSNTSMTSTASIVFWCAPL